MRRVSLVVAVLLAAALLAGCGGARPAHPTATPGAVASGATTTAPGNTTWGVITVAPPGDSSGAVNDAFAIDGTLAQVVVAMRAHDAAPLRDLVSADLGAHLADTDYQRLAACLPAGATLQIESRETSVDADTATVTVGFAVTDGGQRSDVQRVWTFHHEPDNSWKLGALPDCP